MIKDRELRRCRVDLQQIAVRAVTLATLLASAFAPVRDAKAQTLARPGWAGSGMKVAQWWRNSVIVEVSPESAGDRTVLSHTRLQLGDLQTLGTDAVLLRGIDVGVPAGSNGADPQLAANYGTLDDFDQLMREASGRRIRLMVELPTTLVGNALLADARFWLNRGVSGLYLQGDAGRSDDQVRALRGVLRGYVGDRVLAGGVEEGASGQVGNGLDMVFATLQGFGGGPQATDITAVRSSIEAARRSSTAVSVATVSATAPAVAGDEAKARSTALLMVRGSVALRAQDVGIGPEEEARTQEAQREAAETKAVETATSPAAAANARRAAAARKASAAMAVELPGDETFAWNQRMIGLHRGNAALLAGEQTLLNEDDAGALVSVWQARAGQPLVAVVNFRGTAFKFNLTQGLAKLRTHGLFLKAVLRSDKGMGAMPLGNVSLPAYGVYLGQLGR